MLIGIIIGVYIGAVLLRLMSVIVPAVVETPPPRKVCWNKPYMRDQREEAVERMRRHIGDELMFNFLTEMGDDTSFDAESYVRWCHTGVALSTQGERQKSNGVLKSYADDRLVTD